MDGWCIRGCHHSRHAKHPTRRWWQPGRWGRHALVTLNPRALDRARDKRDQDDGRCAIAQSSLSHIRRKQSAHLISDVILEWAYHQMSLSHRSRTPRNWDEKVHRPFACLLNVGQGRTNATFFVELTQIEGVSMQCSSLTQQSTSGENERKVQTDHASVQNIGTTDFLKSSGGHYLRLLCGKPRDPLLRISNVLMMWYTK